MGRVVGSVLLWRAGGACRRPQTRPGHDLAIHDDDRFYNALIPGPCIQLSTVAWLEPPLWRSTRKWPPHQSGEAGPIRYRFTK